MTHEKRGNSGPSDLADRIRHFADLVDCALLAGRVEYQTYARKLDFVALRLRGLAAKVRTTDLRRASCLAAFALEAHTLREQLDTCTRFRAALDEEAHADLLRVAGELAILAADADHRLWEMYRRRIGGAA